MAETLEQLRQRVARLGSTTSPVATSKATAPTSPVASQGAPVAPQTAVVPLVGLVKSDKGWSVVSLEAEFADGHLQRVWNVLVTEPDARHYATELFKITAQRTVLRPPDL